MEPTERIADRARKLSDLQLAALIDYAGTDADGAPRRIADIAEHYGASRSAIDARLAVARRTLGLRTRTDVREMLEVLRAEMRRRDRYRVWARTMAKRHALPTRSLTRVNLRPWNGSIRGAGAQQGGMS